ncbi:CoA activase [Myxococcota bacterium]|nr:CoA activase [Myxococcota bacterium]MBU1379540.1 CoA activase [Myxococcota bacterium]MBU1495258.1 CoA activase [Myxococcota bacterium]
MVNNNKYIGLDIGSESVKIVILEKNDYQINCTSRTVLEHNKNIAETLKIFFSTLDWDSINAVCATGRMAGILQCPSIPIPRALSAGFTYYNPDVENATIVNIGAHGFSVLEMRGSENQIYRENGRCSQGTGNFLRQLTGRFNLDVKTADDLAIDENNPSPLSGRCPVILKTDMTHLANKGISKRKILAGLFDAVAENVEVLIKPALVPGDIWLSGQVASSKRIRKHIENFCLHHKLGVNIPSDDNYIYFEAMGAALEASDIVIDYPLNIENIFTPESNTTTFSEIPSLENALNLVDFKPPVKATSDFSDPVFIGLDMGSTGSKGVGINRSGDVVFEYYTKTNGNPVEAVREILGTFKERSNKTFKIAGFGVTGSGREIAGSMLKACFNPCSVYVMNEIAAHARGAVFFDPEVDTIFEIGGQDAKYIRLSNGEVIDSAMNEACSAGTGSFIEEQGHRFAGINNINELSEIALSANKGISLGQHCSVFMAEVIDQAISEGIDNKNIISGIYDSVVSNYLNRVKGSRTIGKKIFCQGMPYSSMALAAATARKTGCMVIIPPSPGLVGALGISLLAKDNISDSFEIESIDDFLGSKLVSRDTFVCKSTKGCGGSGNHCRIDRLQVEVAGETKKFIWGGQCSLYDNGGNNSNSLPDMAPDPFRYRKEYLSNMKDNLKKISDARTIAITDEFALKGLYPFFSVYLNELGFNIFTPSEGTSKDLKRGIEENPVPYCAPMQIYGGVTISMLETIPDLIFLPMIRDIERSDEESSSTVCPLSQASSDIYTSLFSRRFPETIFIRTVIDMGPQNLESKLFLRSITDLAWDLGIYDGDIINSAYKKALETQYHFITEIKNYGNNTINWALENNVIPVIVLGRAYTIYNDVLNSNVPGLLRQLGAVAIPVDAFTWKKDVPVFDTVYWGYSQVNLRAAHEIRRTNGLYSVFCSNYSCGPDSFNLHFADFILEGKPHATIETDGHSGDAGTRTRLEAFLHTVKNDLKSKRSEKILRNQFRIIEKKTPSLMDAKARGDIVLIPRMGEGAEVAAACLRSAGIKAESLDMPDHTALEIGRRHSSGKECLPATVTLGSLLKRVSEAPPEDTFSFFMPTANGPCRFGMYNTFHKMVIHNLGLGDRVQVISQPDSDYFTGIPKGLAVRILASFVTSDLLYDILCQVRVKEKNQGEANRIYEKYRKELIRLASAPVPSLPSALMEVMGSMFGFRKLLSDAAEEFISAAKPIQVPRISVVGEIYVRMDPYSNDFIIDKLEKYGFSPKLAPIYEWLEYTNEINALEINHGRFADVEGPFARTISGFVQEAIIKRLFESASKKMKWNHRLRPSDAWKGASPWLRNKLVGEAILTFGGPVFEFEKGEIDGVVSVGPLECMPNKISEAMYFVASEKQRIPSITFNLNGEPLDKDALENFVYEVRQSFNKRTANSITTPISALPEK